MVLSAWCRLRSRVLRQVQRQRAVGAEQAEAVDRDARRAVAVDIDARHVRGREGHRGLLPEAQRLVERARRAAQQRMVALRVEPAQQHEQVVLEGLLDQLGPEHGSACGTPRCAAAPYAGCTGCAMSWRASAASSTSWASSVGAAACCIPSVKPVSLIRRGGVPRAESTARSRRAAGWTARTR